jgi:cytoskeletal protein RodZ
LADSRKQGRGLKGGGRSGLGLVGEVLLVAAVQVLLLTVIWWSFFYQPRASVPSSAAAPEELASIVTPDTVSDSAPQGSEANSELN